MFNTRNLTYCIIIAFIVFLIPYGFLNAQSQTIAASKIDEQFRVEMSKSPSDQKHRATITLNSKPDLTGLKGMPNEILAKLKSHASSSQNDLMKYLNSNNIRVKVDHVKQYWLSNTVSITATKDVFEKIAERNDVKSIRKNVVLEWSVDHEVQAEDRGQMATAPQKGYSTEPIWDSFERIGLRDFWTQFGFYGKGITVGILSSGVDINHPDIAGKMVTNDPSDPFFPGGWARFDEFGNHYPCPPAYSGSWGTNHTSIIVGGNASGYDIGIAPEAKYIHAMVLEENPWYPGTYIFVTDQIKAGLEWITDPDENGQTDDAPGVVYLPVYDFTSPGQVSDDLKEVIDNMYAIGIMVVAPVGNEGSRMPSGAPECGTACTPGNIKNCIGVGEIYPNGEINTFSGTGPISWNGTGWMKPDIAAPGVDIFVACPGGWEIASEGLAAGHVAGVLALMRQAALPAFNNPEDILEFLASFAFCTSSQQNDPCYAYYCGSPTPKPNNLWGNGEVNALSSGSIIMGSIGTLQGTVYKDGDVPVSGAEVRILDTGQLVYSDASGGYTIDVAADVYHTVEVSKEGFYSATSDPFIVATGGTKTIDIVFPYRISGYLMIPAGGRGVCEPYQTYVQAIENGTRNILDLAEPSQYGYYEVFVPGGSSGTIEPLSTGYYNTADPTTLSFTNIVSDIVMPNIEMYNSVVPHVDILTNLLRPSTTFTPPDTSLVVCPEGDPLSQSLLVLIDFRDEDMQGPVDAGALELIHPQQNCEPYCDGTLNIFHGAPLVNPTPALEPNYIAYIFTSTIGGHGTGELSIERDGTHIGVSRPVRFKSPDYNGDGIVDNVDLAMYGLCYVSGPYDPYWDFDSDGIIDLDDLNTIGIHWMHQYNSGPQSAPSEKAVETLPIKCSMGSLKRGSGISHFELDIVFPAIRQTELMFFGLEYNADKIDNITWEKNTSLSQTFTSKAIDIEAESRILVSVCNDRINPGTDVNLGTFYIELKSGIVSLTEKDIQVTVGGALDYDGDVRYVTNTAVVGSETPTTFVDELAQNYPNPFNPNTSIKYSTSREAGVKLSIYNVAGQLVRTLVDEVQPRGVYRISWNGRDNANNEVASGVYIYRLKTDHFVQSKKMVLLR